jgi:hypothetical protein
MDLNEKIEVQKQAAECWYEGIMSGDLVHAYSGFDEDCTWSGIGSQLERVEYKGRQAIIDYQSAWVNGAWGASMRYSPKNTLCDGDVLMTEWENEATSLETGETYRNRGVCVFDFDGGTTVKRGRVWLDATPLTGHVRRFTEKNVAIGR